MEVFELVSVLGIHTCTMGVPILVEEVKKFEQKKQNKPNLHNFLRLFLNPSLG